MKYLAIDYGSKKTGIAVSDDKGTVAVPFKVVPTEELEAELDHMLGNVLFERIVVGESVNSKGEHNPIFEQTKKFVDKMKEKYEARILNNEIQFIYEKEFMTSKHARSVDEGKNNLGKHVAVDDRAAALTLQRHLDKVNLKNRSEQERQEEFEREIYDDEDL
jgi:putative Holliday junction resolvase